VRGIACVLASFTAWTGVAVADPSDSETFSHKGQFGLSLRTAVGLRAIVPYNESDYCGASDASVTTGNAAVCTARAPMSLGFEGSYGVTRSIDLLLELRVGLETDFGATAGAGSGPRMLFLSPGARFFFNEAKQSSLFATVQAVFDFSGYKDSTGSGRGSDIGFRNLLGYWFDLHKAYGLYVFAGDTATFSRWIRLELELGIGFQGRYP
jgi:hypothetical protein